MVSRGLIYMRNPGSMNNYRGFLILVGQVEELMTFSQDHRSLLPRIDATDGQDQAEGGTSVIEGDFDETPSSRAADRRGGSSWTSTGSSAQKYGHAGPLGYGSNIGRCLPVYRFRVARFRPGGDDRPARRDVLQRLVGRGREADGHARRAGVRGTALAR